MNAQKMKHLDADYCTLALGTFGHENSGIAAEVGQLNGAL
jgi:hypothetical protein